ncbi:NADH-quinone oxidoreductase subunit NuoG [Immundisolibacter sp.]|uniref:NADH-quinone oxidoreductase subunit NuoG n=1 Tax=Immundisolibacter sp. TaxID=1934948 RepID=UPI0026118970|nr:NADH-quinone oxidoreductase subunit NuoG [Immundisolibacter sp.]MDD3650157.1 NADH-quinone oxidoreductase subunit NuoG [Immundisolibacter sp.]
MSDDLLNIEINGIALQARKGQMIIQAADAAGITIPRFCYHEKLSVAANCRMCLVEVEKMPKTVPACATPLADGMKVFTKSPKALQSQRAVMEFLLINHPLDCPICDEGGECQLQDTALGFGNPQSRYSEAKRAVASKDIGPLIQTEMTRCIHCTRCVRFGEEVAGVKELGATGRGEFTRIGTYIERTVESELSGNVIDLCPVGALTSKPYRFTARAWELARRPGVSPHDCVGSNIEIDVAHGVVKRFLPLANEAVNEIWLSDRDRFSYLGLRSADRLQRPLLRKGGRWEEVSWQEALAAAAEGLQSVLKEYGPAQLGALLAPTLTCEELYLGQKLLRGLGSHNVDHRLRQVDFSADAVAPRQPTLPPIASLEQVPAFLLVGSNLRKDQPLLNTRLRKAVVKHGASAFALASYDYAFNYPLRGRTVCAPQAMVGELAGIAVALLDGQVVPAAWSGRLAGVSATPWQREVASALKAQPGSLILLGDQSVASPYYGALRALGGLIAEQTRGVLAETSPGGNGAGAWLSGAVPHRRAGGARLEQPGLHAAAMLEQHLRAYLLAGFEPEFDCADPAAALAALSAAQLVVVLTPFVTDAMREYADVILPMAAFTETGGSFVNGEGRWQSFEGALKPAGEARPGWKILRVLGNLLDLPGFDYDDVAAVRSELQAAIEAVEFAVSATEPAELRWPESAAGLVRVGDWPCYRSDALVRRAGALQLRADVPKAAVYLSEADCRQLGFAAGDRLRVRQGGAVVELPLVVDARVADGTAYIPSGIDGVQALGAAYGSLMLERV